ncbi:MAG: aspartate dehydrogenase [Candidatus Onthomonas sp.]
MLLRRKTQVLSYDPSKKRPVIRASICTGEQTACLEDLQTGKLEEVMLLRSSTDRAEFCRMCGIQENALKIIY